MFDAGAFVSGLLTGLREGVEAALLISIILAYLAKTGNSRHFAKIALGAGAAVLLSLLLGVVVVATVGALKEPYEQILEAVTMLAATVVVTWMLFWMRRQAAGVRGELEAAVDRVLTEGTVWGLSILAFTAVIREGVETALFLVGQLQAATGSSDGPANLLAGAFAGLALSIAIGWAFYRGSRRLNLRLFFRWTGMALVFIAAGLLSRAVHELVEIGVITLGTVTIVDISSVLPHEAPTGAAMTPVVILGQLLRALFGYTSQPEAITLVAWAAYVLIVLALYLRPVKSTDLRREQHASPQG